MSLLTLSPQSCVRALSVNAQCTHCETHCPTRAISITGKLPAINHALCVGCAGCVSVCPTEALALDDFSPTDFFFAFLSEEENLLSCQKNLPCLAALSPEQLLSFAQMKEGITLDTGHCSGCTLGESVLEKLSQTCEDVNYLLEAIDSPFHVTCTEVGYHKEDLPPQRRDFFKTFHLKELGKIQGNFDKEIQKSTDEFVHHTLDSSHTQALRTKKITDRRKLFYTALKRSTPPEVFHVIDGTRLSFTSQKLMDTSLCTACEMCYRICPTGALLSDTRNSKITFDPFLCVKCHLCHDVCEPNALTLSPSYNLREWYAPKVQTLIAYRVRACDECGTIFSTNQGEKLCRRCALEEEEAHQLWGIPHV